MKVKVEENKMKCPIIEREMELEDCQITIEAVVKEITDFKNSEVPKRVQRRNGWKFICRNCKYHSINQI